MQGDAAMGRFTEANYLSRKVKLSAQLYEARTALSDVGIRRELDNATDADVIRAKGEVTHLEDRLAALDAAWERTVQEQAVAEAAAETASAAASHAEILALLDQRSAAGVEMEAAAEALAKTFAQYQGAGQAVVQHALNHSRRFGADRLRNLRDLFAGDFHDVRPAIGRTLSMGGLDMSSVKGGGFSTDPIHQRSITAFVEWSKVRAIGHVDALIEQPAK